MQEQPPAKPQQPSFSFNIDEKYIDKYLFKPERVSSGPKSYLNINFLPHFFHYLKQSLTEREQQNILDYELQSYILEISMLKPGQKKIRNCRSLMNYVLSEILYSTKYWLYNSEVWKEISNRVKINKVNPQLLLQQQQEMQQIEEDDIEQQEEHKKNLMELRATEEQILAEIKMKEEEEKRLEQQALENTFNEALQIYRQYLEQMREIQTNYPFVHTQEDYLQMHWQQCQNQNTQEEEEWAQLFESQLKFWILYKQFQQSQQLQLQHLQFISRCKNNGLTTQLSRQTKYLLTLDVLKNKSIFVPDRQMRHIKINVVILPFLFRYIRQHFDSTLMLLPQILSAKLQFRIQNFIMLLVFTEVATAKKGRFKNNNNNNNLAETWEKMQNDSTTTAIQSSNGGLQNGLQNGVQNQPQTTSANQSVDNNNSVTNPDNEILPDNNSTEFSNSDIQPQQLPLPLSKKEDDFPLLLPNNSFLLEKFSQFCIKEVSYIFLLYKVAQPTYTNANSNSLLYFYNISIAIHYCFFTKGIVLQNFFSCNQLQRGKDAQLVTNILILVYRFTQKCLKDLLITHAEKLGKLNCNEYDDFAGFVLQTDSNMQEQQIQIEDELNERKKLRTQTKKKMLNNDDSSIIEVLNTIELYENFTFGEAEKIVDFYLQNLEFTLKTAREDFHQYFEILKKQQKSGLLGCFSPEVIVQNCFKTYQNYIQSPDTQQKRSYMFHQENRKRWNDERYIQFLKGFQKYFDNPINNKKIALFMGGAVDPNHVRFVKGQYMRNLRKRAKSQNITLKEQLQYDIDNFHPRIFEGSEFQDDCDQMILDAEGNDIIEQKAETNFERDSEDIQNNRFSITSQNNCNDNNNNSCMIDSSQNSSSSSEDILDYDGEREKALQLKQ